MKGGQECGRMGKKGRKAQVSSELVTMIGAALLVFVVVFVFMRGNVIQAGAQNVQMAANDSQSNISSLTAPRSLQANLTAPTFTPSETGERDILGTPTPAPSHLECISLQCIPVDGEGLNQCASDDDCIPAPTPTSTPIPSPTDNPLPTTPVITNVQDDDNHYNWVRITWNTDISSNSKVEYGLSIPYSSNATNATLTVNHSVYITGLQNTKTYNYRVWSCASGLCNASQNYQFVTCSPLNPKCTLPQID